MQDPELDYKLRRSCKKMIKVCLSVCLSVCLPACLPACLPSIGLSVYLSKGLCLNRKILIIKIICGVARHLSFIISRTQFNSCHEKFCSFSKLKPTLRELKITPVRKFQ